MTVGRGETSAFSGHELEVEEGLIFLPTPTHSTIPVLVGGMSARALRRAAELGDGWIPDAPIELIDFEVLTRLKDDLTARRAEAGRDALTFEHVLVVDTPPDRVGDLPGIARRAGSLGFDELIIDAPFDDPPAVEATLAAVRAELES